MNYKYIFHSGHFPAALALMALLAAGLFFFTANIYVADSAKSKPPNILLILSDDHSAPHLGSYGHPDMNTPVLDRLASEGARFTRAYVTAPQCVPSRASIMTGRTPVDIRMTRFTAPLARDILTYPEVLRDLGYFTGIIGRWYHLDGSRNHGDVAEAIFTENKLRTFDDRIDHVRHEDTPPNKKRWVYQDFEQFLDLRPDKSPFFLQFSFSDPHRPWDADEFNPDFETVTLPPDMPDTSEVRKDFAKYLGEIARMDSRIGYLVSVLQERKLDQNTLIVFMGDNGAAILRGKGTLYESGLKVPLIAWMPGVVAPGIVCDEMVSGIDLAPTFIEVAGGITPAGMEGKSFLSALTGDKFSGHEFVYASRGSHGKGLPKTTRDFDLSRAVVSKKFKFIYNTMWQLPYTPVDVKDTSAMWLDLTERNKQGQLSDVHSRLLFASSRPMFELYNFENDPHELKNLVNRPEYADEQEKMREKLEVWMILNEDYLPLPFEPR